MVRILVVDDEIYALKGITQGIDWSDLPIQDILEADDVNLAKRLLEEQPIDLVISDIEMPGANGLELLRWIHDYQPRTLTIFLTGHARFDFAQEALQHGCFDYILKPVDHDVLKEIVRRAIAEIGLRRDQRKFEQSMEESRKQWTLQLPILVERFWQELLNGQTVLSADWLNRQLELYHIPLETHSRVLPVLLSIEQWDIELDARDENIMEYAVRKAAAETIVADWPGLVLQDRNELNVVLLYINNSEIADPSQLINRCEQYIAACYEYFHCRISCYVGEATAIDGLPEALERLQQVERLNVTAPQSVQTGFPEIKESVSAMNGSLPSFADWGMLLEHGEFEELNTRIAAELKSWPYEQVSRETLELFHYGILHMLYQAAYRKSLSIYEIASLQELTDVQAPRSIQQLLVWSVKMVGKLGRAIAERQRDPSNVIAKIHAYIADNLQMELTRDGIAHSVFLNPAYLSRLYRKETGYSLSEYIAQLRIDRARRLLTDTNDKISNIAEDVGYMHFSYFAKLFKKMVGLTPQEYRKKHQLLP